MKNLKKLLKSTKRTLYVNDEVLNTAPTKIKGKFELFTIGKYISCEELQKEYESRGLVPADIETMVKHDKEIAMKKYVGTQWKDTDDKYCFATFNRWNDGERHVGVDRLDDVWDDGWWFAGVRKSGTLSSKTQKSFDTYALSTLIDEMEVIIKKIKNELK